MRSKNVLLCVSLMSIFALTGCMKFLLNDFPQSKESFNAKYSITEPSEEVTTSSEEVQNSTMENFSLKFYGVRYEQLTYEQKITYDEIYQGIQNCSSNIYLSQKITQEDLEKVYDAVINTASFELVYPTRKYDYKYDNISGEVSQVKPDYNISYQERQNMIAQVDTIANQIISEVQGLGTFETLRYFHDYIITHCDYDNTSNNYSNAYGVFIEGKAVCEGYSRAFKYLCDMVGIPCELVIGNTDIDHMWNLVQIDGEWYHIDVTWDDPENKGGDYIGYSYFNLTDSQIFINHSIDDTSIFPTATATDMNFFNYYGLCASTMEEVYNLIYGEVYRACINGDKYVYISIADKSTYDEAFNTLSENDWYVMYNIIKNASSSADNGLNISDVICSYDADMLTFTISLM